MTDREKRDHVAKEGVMITTISITEENGSLSVTCHIPEEAQTKVSGELAKQTMNFIQRIMNRLTDQNQNISTIITQ